VFHNFNLLNQSPISFGYSSLTRAKLIVVKLSYKAMLLHAHSNKQLCGVKVIGPINQRFRMLVIAFPRSHTLNTTYVLALNSKKPKYVKVLTIRILFCMTMLAFAFSLIVISTVAVAPDIDTLEEMAEHGQWLRWVEELDDHTQMFTTV